MPIPKLLVVALVGAGAAGFLVADYVRVPGVDNDVATHPSTNKLGYLAASELPNTVSLLPPPPSPGSPAMRLDEEAREAALPLKGSARYSLAAADAVRAHQNTVDDFQCAFGTAIDRQSTPSLYELLSRVRLDVRAASYAAKLHFKRKRPFDVHNSQTCYSDDEAMARGDYSYPSARGAVGWSYAIVLAELRPDRKEQMLNRARDFGESRIICDQEWKSDIEAGKTVAMATLDRIRATEKYRADYKAAQQEVARQLASRVLPTANCARETSALASREAGR